MGFDLSKVFCMEDFVKGDDVIFVVIGVIDGELLKGV